MTDPLAARCTYEVTSGSGYKAVSRVIVLPQVRSPTPGRFGSSFFVYVIIGTVTSKRAVSTLHLYPEWWTPRPDRGQDSHIRENDVVGIASFGEHAFWKKT